MYVGSLFSGIGGIELGFEREGFTTKWFCEIEPYPATVFSERFPGIPNLGDITKVDWESVAKVDVLVGGFPCQDISIAGKRKGIKEGKRSSLWKYYVKAISVLRPKWVVAENVSAILQRDLHHVLTDLAEIRYDCEWYIIPAASVGTPHRRERIFIIAYPNTIRCLGGTTEEDTTERKALSKSCYCCENVSNSSSEGLEGEQYQTRQTTRCSEESSNTNQTRMRELEFLRKDTNSIRQDFWKVEPDMGRVVDGISRGMDNYIWRERIKALGNAVVPQVAQVVARSIKQYKEEKLK